MSSGKKFLAQALSWIDEVDNSLDVELCIDLPNVGWVRVHSLVETDGDITCQYTSGLLTRRSAQTLICSIEKIAAIRRSDNLVSLVNPHQR